MAAIAILAVTVGAGCGKGKKDEPDFGPDLVDADTALASSLVVSPPTFEFTHVIGDSPCPQVVGTFSIRNTGPFRVTARVGTSAPLVIRETAGFSRGRSVEVEGRQEARIEVLFDCSVRSDFTSMVTVSAGSQALRGDQVVGRVR